VKRVTSTREGAHQGVGHGEAGRGGQEIVHRQAEHLGEMSHRRLAAIVLPVGVGDEAGRSVERERRSDRAESLRIERQDALQSLDGVERKKTDDRESDHRNRIDEGALLLRLVDARETIEAALDRQKYGR
jgi:hypothetical protein